MRKRNRKKSDKEKLMENLDKEMSRLVRSRGRCEFCGDVRHEKLQAAHIWTRKIKSVRWDEDNLLCLCASCHSQGHDRPVEFYKKVKSVLGENRISALQERVNTPKKWTVPELKVLMDEIKSKQVGGRNGI